MDAPAQCLSCQVGRMAAFSYGLNNCRGKKSQRNETSYKTTIDPLARRYLLGELRTTRGQLIEPLPTADDRFQESRIGCASRNTSANHQAHRDSPSFHPERHEFSERQEGPLSEHRTGWEQRLEIYRYRFAILP